MLPIEPTSLNQKDWIPFETRRDVKSFYFNDFQRSPYYIVKDPLKASYFELDEIEHFILAALKSAKRYSEITEQLHRKFSVSLDREQLQLYLEKLSQYNLIRRLYFGAGFALSKEKLARTRLQLTNWFFGWLSIKLPGFYPGPVIGCMSPLGKLFFSRIFLVCFLLISLGTFFFSLTNFQSLTLRVPHWQQLIEPQHILATLVAFILVKIAHELGHALACHRVGHECTEIGIVFLVFLPCLYCEVSDLWTERNKWKRILVSLAGVVVEMSIAILCFWLWYFLKEGPASALCFSILIVTSANTLFANGNPLMKYDGYYALSDLLGVPNLYSNANLQLRNSIVNFFSREQSQTNERWQRILVVYALAAFAYRILILTSIGLAVVLLTEQIQLEWVGALFGCLITITLVLPLSLGVYSTFLHMNNNLSYLKFSLFVFATLAITYFVLHVPVNYRIRGTAVFELSDANELFCLQDGFFQPKVVDGELVAQGQVIGKLKNIDMEIEKQELVSEILQLNRKIESLEIFEINAAIAAEKSLLVEQKNSLNGRLKELESKINSLQVTSPKNGRFVAVRPSRKKHFTELKIERENFFDPKLEGIFLERGSLLGYVGLPNRLTGRLNVPEPEVELLCEGQEAEVFCIAENLVGTVSNIRIESSADQQNENPGSIWDQQIKKRVFVAEIEVDEPQRLRVGSARSVVIRGQPISFWRFLSRKFEIVFR